MNQKAFQNGLFMGVLFTIALTVSGQTIVSGGEDAELTIFSSGEHSIRITLKPTSFEDTFPYSPALVAREWPNAALRLREIFTPLERRVGNFRITVSPNPLTVVVKNRDGDLVTDLVFDSDDSGQVSFRLDHKPVLGMGEGGPGMGENWREEPLEFDRNGRFHNMAPRWQAQAYGSRNPVPFLIGTGGWALFVATPWVHVDLRNEDRGRFIPWRPPVIADVRRRERALQGRPPISEITPGVFDVFVFDASHPEKLMKEISLLTGQAVMPPKWALGYMQSHRTLEDESQMIRIVDTFRAKNIPIDAVIYLGTGFCPRGWNTEQPSVTFNPEVFKRSPEQVISDLHERNVKVVVHIVPWESDSLPTLHGNIPPGPGETIDKSHIQTYWKDHLGLIDVGIDAFWPDEGDRFDLFERMTRHKLYYQGPLSSRPNVRPWSLHRNGHLGVARWGGWIWSGDPNSAWQTLRGQIRVGQNHSLSLSPFWGSDTGGFYPSEELTGELYARWFQFSAFSPSFRSHGRTWWTRLPWGWGLSEMGPLENRSNPLPTELNNPKIEPICRKYAELRYKLLPYIYSLAWQARETGMPLMRAMWLHYPDDDLAVQSSSQYLWGRDMLIAPVATKGATSRDVYLPAGDWYDWWTNERFSGKRNISREVDLSTMPIYVRAGAILPFDPSRQYTAQAVDDPTTLKVFRGADGGFTLYEDDGVSLDYLDGKAQWTRLTWDDTSRRLRIEPDANQKSDMVSNRTFIVELIPDGLIKEVRYTGKRVEVRF